MSLSISVPKRKDMHSQKNLPRSSSRSLPLNAFKTAKEYANWIDQRITSFVDPERLEWQPIENYLQWNALFVTFTFDKRKIGRRKSALNDSSASFVSTGAILPISAV
jgi:hypothetical protein